MGQWPVWVELRAVIRRLCAVLCCLAVLGCSAADPAPTGPVATASAPVSVPSDGVLLASLGFRNAPMDFTVPMASVVSDRVDQENTVVAVFTAPSGLDIAAYLRNELPQQGWDITADGNSSLLFERGEVHGAFTVNGAWAAVSIRYDERS